MKYVELFIRLKQMALISFYQRFIVSTESISMLMTIDREVRYGDNVIPQIPIDSSSFYKERVGTFSALRFGNYSFVIDGSYVRGGSSVDPATHDQLARL